MYSRQVFSTYTHDSLEALLLETAVFRASPLRPVVSFHDGRPSLVKVRFHAGARLEFIVPETFNSEERRDFYTNRWFACCAMFVAAKEAYPDLRGECHFWVDDMPHGSGLAFCGNSVSHILVPDSVFFETGGYDYLRQQGPEAIRPWKARASTVFWRGASTGLREMMRLVSWRDIPRFKLCMVAQQLGRPETYDIGVSNVVQIWDANELAEIAESGLLRDEVPQSAFMDYRYAIDIDGNTCSWPGLFTKLLMANVVMKPDSYNGYRQWYYDRLIPWRNFVPLLEDLANLAETTEYLMAHPDEAERVAYAGRDLVETMTFEAELKRAAGAVQLSVRS